MEKPTGQTLERQEDVSLSRYLEEEITLSKCILYGLALLLALPVITLVMLLFFKINI